MPFMAHLVVSCVEEAAPRRFGLAMLIACPFCAGGFILALGAILGIGAVALKAGLFVGGVVFLLTLWARNIWRRRHEDACCPLPNTPASDNQNTP
jgi:membrane protein implicated in regulation of membrane protease activity